MRSLVDLSSPSETDDELPSDADSRLRELGIAYFVVNRDTAIDERLPRQRLESAGFELVQKSGSRELYVTR